MKSMSVVDDAFQQYLRSLSGTERVVRAIDHLCVMSEMLTHQLKEKLPNASEREIRKEVAKRFYMSEPHVLSLIERADR